MREKGLSDLDSHATGVYLMLPLTDVYCTLNPGFLDFRIGEDESLNGTDMSTRSQSSHKTVTTPIAYFSRL